MNFFDIGPLEILVVLIIAFILFGPEKLPQIAAAIGKGMRKLKEATTELSKDFQEMTEEAKGVEKEVKTAGDATTGLSKDLKEVSKEVKDAMTEAVTSVAPARESNRDLKDISSEIEAVAEETETSLAPTLEEAAKDQVKGDRVEGGEGRTALPENHSGF
jgi:TatA/E family protein of Tat protein translocase